MRVFDVITVPCYMELSLRHSELAPRSAYVTKNSYITQWTEKNSLGACLTAVRFRLAKASPSGFPLQVLAIASSFLLAMAPGFLVQSLTRNAASTQHNVVA